MYSTLVRQLQPTLAGPVTWSLQTHSDCIPMNILMEKLKNIFNRLYHQGQN